MKLMTVGYEGLRVEEFFDLLVMHGVETLVDIRENPISRKRGFSKNALMIAAASEASSTTTSPLWVLQKKSGANIGQMATGDIHCGFHGISDDSGRGYCRAGRAGCT